jgi:hypothetical protein
MKYSTHISFLLFTLSYNLGFGQAQFKVLANRDTLLFGETADIVYDIQNIEQSKKYVQIDFSKYENILFQQDSSRFEKYADVFIGFEDSRMYAFYNAENKILSYPVSEIKSGEGIRFKAIIKFLSYGKFQHPTPELVSGEEKQTITGENTQIIVKLPSHLKDSEQLEINDIKPIVEVYRSFWNKYGILLLGLVALIATIFGVRKYLAKRPAKVAAPVISQPEANPADIALKALNELNRVKPWLKETDLSRYQTELTMIIRLYLSKRYGINALEHTSSEIVASLEKQKLLSNQLRNEVREILEISDLVKFAKAKPSSDINQDFLDRSIHFVVQTKENI